MPENAREMLVDALETTVTTLTQRNVALDTTTAEYRDVKARSPKLEACLTDLLTWVNVRPTEPSSRSSTS
jgi:hypothetical protein